jgi:hypothetical protein
MPSTQVATVPKIAFIENEKSQALKRLDEFAELPYDWNDNCAEPFSPDLIKLAKIIIHNLKQIPDVFPTARNSIQMEYEEGEKYLEFEIFISHINVYFVNADGDEDMYTVNTEDYHKLNEAIEKFYD